MTRGLLCFFLLLYDQCDLLFIASANALRMKRNKEKDKKEEELKFLRKGIWIGLQLGKGWMYWFAFYHRSVNIWRTTGLPPISILSQKGT